MATYASPLSLNAKRVLTLDTYMGGDVLLPTKLNGEEGISRPFSYDLTAVTYSQNIVDLSLTPFASLIGTMARIGIWKGPENTDRIFRTGMISHFEESDPFNPGMGQNNLHVYKITLVPAVQMLGRQSAYRIFENRSVVSIINALLADMQSRFPNFLYDTSRLIEADFQPMEYCVQHGESTFAFLTRLMERFGIWYIFDNPQSEPDTGSSNDPTAGGDQIMMAENTNLVLGRMPYAGFLPCDVNMHKVTDDDPVYNPQDTKDPDSAGDATVANFRRRADPVLQSSWVGNYNILDPTNPITKTEALSDSSNVLASNRAVAGFFQSEAFPCAFENDPGAVEEGASAGQGDRNALDYAQTRMQEQRVLCAQVTGATANPTLKAGRVFTISSQENSQGEPGDYLVSFMTISAFENSYQTQWGTDVLNFLFRDFLLSPFQSGKSVRNFLLTGVAVAGLNNYLQNQQARQFYNWWYPNGSNHPSSAQFVSFTAGGITQVGLTSVIPALIDDVGKLIDQNSGGYVNSFVAFQRPAAGPYPVAPLPEAGPRPVVHGPQLAVVIGQNGVDGKQGIYADALGRVRIRFPWDPGPPSKQGGVPTPWSAITHPHQPYETGANTCWVRVSEGWAGEHFGSQFLPRNGQEVLVGFLDGNPERPIIIGRVYNASSGTSNLPYPPKGTPSKILGALQDLCHSATNLMLRSGIKTRSVPQPAHGRGFHMLRFDDTGGAEQLLLRSQGRLDVTALGTKYETIGGNYNLTVGWLDAPHKVVGGSRNTKIFENCSVHVGDGAASNGGTLSAIVEKDAVVQIKRRADIMVEGALAVGASGLASIAADTIVLQANKKITLKVGGAFLTITPAGVLTSGVLVGDKSGGAPGDAVPVHLPNMNNPARADDGST